LILWLISSLALTLLWVWLLLTPGIQAEWAFPIGLCITALLPTGVVNPITVAGVLFPGLGWAGLIATIILFGALSRFRLYSVAITAMLSAICYVSHPGIPVVPSTWQGHDTELGGSELSKQTSMALYNAVVYVQETAIDSNAPIQVFPEGIINHWTPSAEGFWQSTYSELQQNHQSILFGAEEYGSHGGQYRNELLLRGQYTATFQQRVPIPYAMWRPWDNIGVPIHYFGPATLAIGPRRTAPIICYEQLLVAPVLLSAQQKPDVFLAVANDYWARDTYIPNIQQAAITAWSRLFWIPLVTATNR
jgi:apolipoprotein N-acyltransferase